MGLQDDVMAVVTLLFNLYNFLVEMSTFKVDFWM